MEFEKERVHCVWDEKLVGKKVFAADEICDLKRILKEDDAGLEWRVVRENTTSHYPFAVTNGITQQTFRFVYVLDDPPLTWRHLKVGDVIRKDNMTEMVTAIDAMGNTREHIRTWEWLSDEELEEWVKVYDV